MSGSLVMTTAAAWMPSWRRRPSRPLATSITRRASSSVAYISRRPWAAAYPSSWPFDAVETGPQRGVAAHDERRHGLGDPVPHDVRVPEHPGRVAHRGPRLDGREGDDLRHAVGAVALGGVADHLAPVALVEVHVDVGHLLAAGIQEALEQQVVADRVEVDDPEAVGHAAPGGRAPPGPDPDPALPGVADQVPHDEEVGGEAHAGDDAELVVEALAHRRRAATTRTGDSARVKVRWRR